MKITEITTNCVGLLRLIEFIHGPENRYTKSGETATSETLIFIIKRITGQVDSSECSRTLTKDDCLYDVEINQRSGILKENRELLKPFFDLLLEIANTNF